MPRDVHECIFYSCNSIVFRVDGLIRKGKHIAQPNVMLRVKIIVDLWNPLKLKYMVHFLNCIVLYIPCVISCRNDPTG